MLESGCPRLHGNNSSHDIGAGCFYSGSSDSGALTTHHLPPTGKSETTRRGILHPFRIETKRHTGPRRDFLVGGGKTELAHHLSTVPHYPYTSDYGPGLPGRDWATGGRPHSPPNLRQPCLESTHRHPGSHPPNFWAFWGLFLADKGVTAGSGDKVVQVTR